MTEPLEMATVEQAIRRAERSALRWAAVIMIPIGAAIMGLYLLGVDPIVLALLPANISQLIRGLLDERERRRRARR